MQRRRLLKLGIVGATAMGVLSGVTLLLQQTDDQDLPLSRSAIELLSVFSAALLEGTMPERGQLRDASMATYLRRLAETVSGLPPRSQLDLAQLLSLLARAPGRRILTGLGTDWPVASAEQIRDALETMRRSRLMLRRQVYHALRDLVRAAWYVDSSTWRALGYPGPQSIA